MLRALSLSIALILCLGLANSASAQDLKIAVVNPAKIFGNMLETKDLKEKMEAQGKDLNNQEEAQKKELEAIQAKLKMLNAGSPQHNEAQKEFIEKAIKYETWKKINQAQVQQDQKLSMKVLFDKITEATKAIADAEKIDLVIAETNVEFPDIGAINVDQLRALINQRNVIVNNGKADISDKVTTKLDADYKAGKK